MRALKMSEKIADFLSSIQQGLVTSNYVSLHDFISIVTSMIDVAESSDGFTVPIRTGLKKIDVNAAELTCLAVDSLNRFRESEIDVSVIEAAKSDVFLAFSQASQRRAALNMPLNLEGTVPINQNEITIAAYLGALEWDKAKNKHVTSFMRSPDTHPLVNAIVLSNSTEDVATVFLASRFTAFDSQSTRTITQHLADENIQADIFLKPLLHAALTMCESQTGVTEKVLLETMTVCEPYIDKASVDLFLDSELNLTIRLESCLESITPPKELETYAKELKSRKLFLIAEKGAEETRKNTSNADMEQAEQFVETFNTKLRF
jgi:hypothetical protein